MSAWSEMPPIEIDQNSEVPKYSQLARSLEGLIIRGVLQPNNKLPSENEFFEFLNLSRSTIRKALEILESKKLVFRRQGQGTYVSPNGPIHNGDSFGTMLAETQQQYTANPAMPSWSKGLSKRHPSETKGIISLLLPSMDNEIYPQIVRGVESVAAANGWTVFIGNTYANRERELTLMRQMIERKVDGLIIELTHARFDKPDTQTYQLLKNYTGPCVLIDNYIPGIGASTVMIDDVSGGKTATEYLIARGHRKIAYIYQETVIAAVDRRDGYLKALSENGIPVIPELIVPYSEEHESRFPGYHLTLELLKKPNRPSAIFYFNDELAFQGIKAIRDLGLEIPRDVSIIGFDNVGTAAASDIQLTTLEHPKYFTGRWAADILFDQIYSGPKSIRRRIVIYPELVIRNSVADFLS